MITKGNGTAAVKGRPPKEDRGEIVRNNGFTENQWKWLQNEARKKGIDAMSLARWAVQWWIDSVEASRNGSVANPEDDQKFEKLIKSKHKSKRKQVKRSKSQ